MNKKELIGRVADTTGLSKIAADQAVNAALSSITEALATGDKVQIAGFGSFEVKYRQSRSIVNPQTKERMETSGFHTATFRPSQTLKKQLQKTM